MKLSHFSAEGFPTNPPTRRKSSITFLVTSSLITVTGAGYKQLKRKKDLFCSWLQPIMVGGHDDNTGIMVDRKQKREDGSPGPDI